MNWSAPLRSTATGIFETLCFLIPDHDGPVDEPPRDPSEESIGARIGFSGPYAGALDVFVDRRLANEVRDLVDGGGDVSLEDVVGELANQICGHLLPEVTSCAVEFQVFPPVKVSVDERLPGETSGTADLTFSGLPVSVRVCAEKLGKLPHESVND